MCCSRGGRGGGATVGEFGQQQGGGDNWHQEKEKQDSIGTFGDELVEKDFGGNNNQVGGGQDGFGMQLFSFQGLLYGCQTFRSRFLQLGGGPTESQ